MGGMTQKETPAEPSSLAEIHHFDMPCEPELAVVPEMGLDLATDWDTVTCGACKLERPEDMTGRPEYRVPADVLARDAGLAHADRVARLERRLATIETTVEMTRDTMNVWAKRHGEALALKEATVRELSLLLGAQNAPVVPTSTPEASEPAKAFSGGPWWGEGVRFEIIPAAGAHLRRTGVMGYRTPLTGSWPIKVAPRPGMEGWTSWIGESELRLKRFGPNGYIGPIS